MSDVFDFASVVILNSPDVRAWPVTTRLSVLALRADGVHVEFNKQASWPDVPFQTPSEPLQYTLWLLLKINGAWYASGLIQFWRGLAANGGDVTAESQIARNWVYDARWGPMAHHQPQPGEVVGFMVTAGNARGADQHVVAERSGVVLIGFPAAAGAVFPPYLWEESAPEPPPPPPPPVPDDEIKQLIASMLQVADTNLHLIDAVVKLEARVHELEQNGLKVHL